MLWLLVGCQWSWITHCADLEVDVLLEHSQAGRISESFLGWMLKSDSAVRYCTHGKWEKRLVVERICLAPRTATSQGSPSFDNSPGNEMWQVTSTALHNAVLPTLKRLAGMLLGGPYSRYRSRRLPSVHMQPLMGAPWRKWRSDFISSTGSFVKTVDGRLAVGLADMASSSTSHGT